MMKNNRGELWLLKIIMAVVLVIIMALIIFIGYHKEDDKKVGFIMTGSITDEGWNGKHYQGISQACDRLGVKLLVKENVAEGTNQCETAIQELVEDGVKAIVLSSYAYPMEVEDVIESYPDIMFFSTSSEYHADNLTSYFGKMYQARYLAGMVAGMQTKNNRIGYVAAMPNNEVNRGINGFTMGVKSVNEDASVYVMWTDSWDDKDKETTAANRLIDELDVDVLTYHQNQPYVAQTADARGIYSIGYNETAKNLSDKYLTAAVWDWDKLYYEIIREYMIGDSNKATQHWLGIETGAVQLEDLSPEVSDEVRKRVEREKQELIAGKLIFAGTIFDNEGRLRCDEGEALSETVLLEQMDWFVDGVKVYE